MAFSQKLAASKNSCSFAGRSVNANVASSSRRNRHCQVVQCKKVAVLGAAGGIGQPLSLLLKMNKLVTELSLYDIAGTRGVAADLSHTNTPAKVSGWEGDAELEQALTGCDVVVIPAGVPRKPGMTRDDLFNINAGIVKGLVSAVGKYCPNAILQIISNPVNSTVPIAAETLKSMGVYSPKRVIGVTTLDIVRANTFVAAAKGIDLNTVDVPVVGGHAGITILPLLSQTTPSVTFTEEEREKLTKRIQEAGTEVVEAKAGRGSATLSMAYAAARMAEAALLGLSGEANVYEYGYVESTVHPELPYLSTKLLLGKEGVEKVFELGALSDYETEAFNKMVPDLKSQIEKGIKFASAT